MATVDAVARVATTTRDGATRATLVLGDGARVVRVEDVVRVEVRRRTAAIIVGDAGRRRRRRRAGDAGA